MVKFKNIITFFLYIFLRLTVLLISIYIIRKPLKAIFSKVLIQLKHKIIVCEWQLHLKFIIIVYILKKRGGVKRFKVELKK